MSETGASPSRLLVLSMTGFFVSMTGFFVLGVSSAEAAPTLPNIPAQCVAATVTPQASSPHLWRDRTQLTKAELACYYELHRLTRQGLDRAILSLRSLYSLNPPKVSMALYNSQCALMVEAGDLMLVENRRTKIDLITPTLASQIGSRGVLAQRGNVNRQNAIDFTGYVIGTTRLLHALHAPRSGSLC